MTKTVSFKNLLEKEASAVNKYCIWSESVDVMMEKIEKDPVGDYSLFLDHDMTLVNEAISEMESARKELANYIRTLMSEY